MPGKVLVSKGLYGRWETEEGVRIVMIMMKIMMMAVKMVGDGSYDDGWGDDSGGDNHDAGDDAVVG